MRLIELFESLSGTVYHMRSSKSAYQILSEKRFRLSNSLSIEDEEKLTKGHRYYFMSVARSPYNNFTISNMASDTIMFNLNGEWFNKKYKSAPVDFLERDWIEHRREGDDEATSEMEDRIYSYKPYINIDPKNVIEEIHILSDEGEVIDYPYIELVILKALQYHIPIWIYFDPRSFLIQNKKNTIPIEEVLGIYGHYEEDDDKERNSNIKKYIDLFNGVIDNKLVNTLKSNINQFIKDLRSEIKKDPNSQNTYEFLKLLKRNRLKTLQDYAVAVQERI